MNTKSRQKTGPPQIVMLDKAFKLAELWVDNMTKTVDDEPTEVESGGRPPRLGLGAKVSRQSNLGPSNDPVERKLYAKLDAGKRKAAKSTEESTPSDRDGCDDDDDDDENLESRTSAFSKKRAVPLASSLQMNSGGSSDYSSRPSEMVTQKYLGLMDAQHLPIIWQHNVVLSIIKAAQYS